MRTIISILCVAALAATGCKKTGGGGGGCWLVGHAGLMASVDDHDRLGPAYPNTTSADLFGIACRYAGEAWVVGAGGTLLYTNDGGASWRSREVPTTADLHALATQDSGPVYLGGDGVFLASRDSGATWDLQPIAGSVRSIAAAQEAETVLAVSDDGGIWRYDAGTLARRATIDGARAIAISPDGTRAIAVGAGVVAISRDGGATWTSLAIDPAQRFDSARIDDTGEALAVGAGGTIASIAASGAVDLRRAGDQDLHAIHVDDDRGFAAGESGVLWITDDRGASWRPGPDVGRTVYGMDEIGAGHL